MIEHRKEAYHLNTKELFCKHIRDNETAMYMIAKGILKNDSDVADIIQESILKAYTNFDSLQNINKLPKICQV